MTQIILITLMMGAHAGHSGLKTTIRTYEFERYGVDWSDPTGLPHVYRGKVEMTSGPGFTKSIETVGDWKQVVISRFDEKDPQNCTLVWKTLKDGHVRSFQTGTLSSGMLGKIRPMLKGFMKANAGGSADFVFAMPAQSDDASEESGHVEAAPGEAKPRLIDGVLCKAQATKLQMSGDEVLTVSWTPVDQRLSEIGPSEIYQYRVAGDTKTLTSYEKDTRRRTRHVHAAR